MSFSALPAGVLGHGAEGWRCACFSACRIHGRLDLQAAQAACRGALDGKFGEKQEENTEHATETGGHWPLARSCCQQGEEREGIIRQNTTEKYPSRKKKR